MRTTAREAPGWHRPLMWFAAAMVVVAVVSGVEYNLDDRLLVDVPIWAKPLQFSISFGVYAVTLAWLISQLRAARVRRLAQRTGTVIAVATGVEMIAIVVQVLRGQQSHFNYTTPFNRAVFGTMGVAVLVIFVATVVVGVALLRESPAADRATTLAVRCGLGVTVLGMSVGFLMVIPRASQRGALIRGAHSVGAPDGGPSMPLTGWSSTGGDLRVAHFVGLHALQALPLLAVALTVLPATARLAGRTRARLVLVGTGAWVGLFALTLWQALRGQPLLRPDTATVATLAALAVSTSGVAWLVLRVDERTADRTTNAAAPEGVAASVGTM